MSKQPVSPISWRGVPTPPAPQTETVTLTREMFEQIIGALNGTFHASPLVGPWAGVKRALELLRSAETQK